MFNAVMTSLAEALNVAAGAAVVVVVVLVVVLADELEDGAACCSPLPHAVAPSKRHTMRNDLCDTRAAPLG